MRLSALYCAYTRILIAVSVAEALTRRAVEHEKKPEEWYTTYGSYPPYCSTPEQMSTRGIPPLDNSIKYGQEARIAHVTAIIRHGARTPWTSDLKCWENYHTDPETGSWNCDLTTWLAPPSPQRVEQEENIPVDTSGADAMFLFEKQYDALLFPQYNASNLLNGTCQMGQLLLQGYEQQMTNGKHFRQAYVYDSKDESTDQTDPRMQLIDVSGLDEASDDIMKAWDRRNFHFRADDDQRTIMSGQVLLRGMLQKEIDDYVAVHGNYPVLPLHTADRVRDVLDPNDKVCPRLSEIRRQLEQSEPYLSFMDSEESRTLLRFQHDVLKIPKGQMMDSIDCLMTTICTDRKLPDSINDYKGEPDKAKGDLDTGNDGGRRRRLGDSTWARRIVDYGDNMFARLYNWDVKRFVMRQTYNHAEYAKLGMSFLWAEIMEGISRVVEEKDAVKLSLISGHDTTIMPLLVTLGPRVFDGKWAPYASNLVFEIYHLPADRDLRVYVSDFAFRLIYNGKVLTPLIDNCTDDLQLCDAQILIERVKPFATRSLTCHVSDEEAVSAPYYGSPSASVASMLTMLLLSVTSALLGSLLTYWYVTRAVPRVTTKHRRQQLAQDAEEEHGRSMTLRVYGAHVDESEGEFT